jgi:hypothetical protein
VRQEPSRGLPTTAKDAQRDRTLFSGGGFAFDVLGAAHFGYLEKTGDMAQVGPDLIANGGIVVGQHVETLGCEHIDGFEKPTRNGVRTSRCYSRERQMVARRKESHQERHEHKVVYGIQGLVRRFPALFFLRQPKKLRDGADKVGEEPPRSVLVSNLREAP